MRSYLDFEKPVAELDAKLDELRALAASGSDIGEEILRVEDKRLAGAGRPLRQPDAVAEDAGGAASAAPAPGRLRQGADHRIHAAGRRPQVRRGRGAGRRLRPFPRREHLRDRPGKGRHHRRSPEAQFRHGAAGRLSQGRAADGDGRPLRHSRAVAGRFRRRLSRHRRRGARPGGGDRALHRRLPAARRAQRRRHHRRRRCRAAPSPLPPPARC